MNRHHPSRGRRFFGLLLLWLAVPSLLLAPPPDWWAERGATNENPPDDYAAANLGQLKQMAVKAREELNARLPGGAGQPIETMIAGWNQPNSTTRDDYAAVTLGQLKYVGKLFYDRLNTVGYPAAYPWASSPNPPDDTAIANLGQVKLVFAFELDSDADGNGMPDWWELAFFGVSGVNPTGDLDSDGVTNLEEFQNWTADYYNGHRPGGVPIAPSNVIVHVNADGSKDVYWTDNSNNETEFIVRDHLTDGTIVEIGRVGPDDFHLHIAPP